MNNIQFTVKYNGNSYSFEYGSQVYIFHTGIYNEIDKKYGTNGLLEYVAFVQECYLKDSNRTPLGALGDFIAKYWRTVQKLYVSDVLEKFYLEGDY